MFTREFHTEMLRRLAKRLTCVCYMFAVSARFVRELNSTWNISGEMRQKHIYLLTRAGKYIRTHVRGLLVMYNHDKPGMKNNTMRWTLQRKGPAIHLFNTSTGFSSLYISTRKRLTIDQHKYIQSNMNTWFGIINWMIADENNFRYFRLCMINPLIADYEHSFEAPTLVPY